MQRPGICQSANATSSPSKPSPLEQLLLRPSNVVKTNIHLYTLLIHTVETNTAMNPPTILLATTPEALPFVLGVTVDSCSWLS